MNNFFIKYLAVFLLLVSTSVASAQNLPLDAQGWTIFTPSSDSRIIYVSSTDGNDATAINYSVSQVSDPFNPNSSIRPYKTVAQARRQLRDNYPDWILFKRGDVWYEPIAIEFKLSGRSADKPMLFGAYGDLSQDRPTFKTGESLCVSASNNGGGSGVSNYLAFVSLHAYANERNPDDPEYKGAIDSGQKGFSWVRRSNGILLEDMKFDFYATNMSFQATWAPGRDAVIKNLTIRRCILTDAYRADSHRQGLFVNRCENVLIEENVFDYNGWREGVRNSPRERQLGHNVYIQYENGSGTVNVLNNIVTRGSSHGVQLRSGGMLNGNYFARNPLHSFNRGDFFACINNDNVYQESVDIVGSNFTNRRGLALELFDLHPDYSHECKRNIISNDLSGITNSYAIRVSDFSAATMGELETDYKQDWPSYAFNLTIEDNIVYNHRRGLHFLSDRAEDITIKNNMIQNPGFDEIVMEESSSRNHTNTTFTGNKYYSAAATNDQFRLDRDYISYNQWSTATGDNSSVEQVNFPNPGRTSADYAASLGFGNSFEAFITEARKQRKGYWRPEFTSFAINNYIREGYGSMTLNSESIVDIDSHKPKMHPNPVSTYQALNVSSEYLINGTLRIIDLKGAVVFSETSKSKDMTVDVGKALKPGFYVVSITTADAKSYNTKLVVK